MTDDKDFDEVRDEELDRVLEESENKFSMPGNTSLDLSSREYKTFKKEEKKQHKESLYEKACNLCGDLVNIEPGEDKRKELARSINVAYLHITPTGAYSFAILSGLGIFVLAILLFAVGLISPVFALFTGMMGGLAIYFLAEFPNSQARLFKVKAANEIMLATIYIVIYMRTTPNLEGAIRFASEHLEGPLSKDFKKLLWDVETRKYASIKTALLDYMDKWKDNEPFVEAMQIIQNSMEQGEERRKNMLDEAVNTMMSGSREMMKEYSNKLEMPIMVIHALGIMLPIMVLVMFPIMFLMMKETIKPIFLIVGYDVLLPIVIYLTGKRTLEYRPVGFSAPNISMHPKYDKMGKLVVGEKRMPIWPFSILLSIIVFIIGVFALGAFSAGSIFREMMISLIFTWGVAIGLISYLIGKSHGKLQLRKKIKDMEGEFSEALFSLGNRLSLGEPMEKAMDTTVKKNQGLEISQLFKKALRNMRRSGMNLKNSLFDDRFGAVWDYPSQLIHSILKIVVQSANKGVHIASLSTISISKYLKEVREIEKDLKNMLSSETTSMEFLGAFLAPLVAGVSVTMASMMMMIFKKLGESMNKLQVQGNNIPGGMGLKNMMIGQWGSISDVIPVSWFQIIVGVYVIEMAYLLSMLASGIEDGPDDDISRDYAAGIIILISTIVYTFTLLITWQVFGSQIQSLLGSGLL